MLNDCRGRKVALRNNVAYTYFRRANPLPNMDGHRTSLYGNIFIRRKMQTLALKGLNIVQQCL